MGGRSPFCCVWYGRRVQENQAWRSIYDQVFRPYWRLFGFFGSTYDQVVNTFWQYETNKAFYLA